MQGLGSSINALGNTHFNGSFKDGLYDGFGVINIYLHNNIENDSNENKQAIQRYEGEFRGGQ